MAVSAVSATAQTFVSRYRRRREVTMTVRGPIGCVLTVATLLTACSSTTPGRPQGAADAPGTPAPTVRPTAAPPSTAETLPNDNGWSFVVTKSGKTRCQLSRDEVGCESTFPDAPSVDGVPANGVRLTTDGHLQWLVGNLGDPPVVPLDYRTYAAQGWTIEASESGTRFTNDATKHGMVVATDGVDAF